MALTFFLRLFFIHVGFISVATITYPCLSNETCGCSLNSAVLTKIVGGEQAGSDTWGWAASIRVGNNHICGGSLISSTIIITAAHCLISIESSTSLRINIGSKYLSSIRQERSVSKIYIHHDYDSNTFINDIAIIRLSSSINMSDPSVALICLPPIVDTAYPPTDTSVVAIGWGVLSSGDKIPSDTLQQVTLKIISYTEIGCRESVNNDNIQFCAGVKDGGKGIKSEIHIRLEWGAKIYFLF
jgi:secreted trypsin-like serine protease